MAALQIPDFPAILRNRLAERARLERRTIAQQATVLLAEALATAPPGERRRAVLRELSRGRKRFDFIRMAKPEDLIRADRNR